MIELPCETCHYKTLNDDPALHCYMFKTKPTPCLAHSDAPKMPQPLGLNLALMEVAARSINVNPRHIL